MDKKENQTMKIDSNEKIQNVSDEDLDRVTGGTGWEKRCRQCGGVINDDPNTPYDVRCHCNSW